jgi:hypothetical protein
MNVQIQERIFSLRAEYDIVSDIGNFFGQKAIFSLGTHIEIRDPAGTTVVTIQTNSIFNIGYSITFADGRIFDFHLQKFWTSVYRCEGPPSRRSPGSSTAVFAGPSSRTTVRSPPSPKTPG